MTPNDAHKTGPHVFVSFIKELTINTIIITGIFSADYAIQGQASAGAIILRGLMAMQHG